MSQWHGFGFSLDECDMESVANFLADKCWCESKRAELLACDNYSDMEKIAEWPLGYLIAEAINEEMGTNVFAYSFANADHGVMIGVNRLYPWEIRGKKYNREECDEILKKYASELGAEKDLENDYYEVEFGR